MNEKIIGTHPAILRDVQQATAQEILKRKEDENKVGAQLSCEVTIVREMAEQKEVLPLQNRK